MAARDPLQRVFDELDPSGLMTLGTYRAQGAGDKFRLQIPAVATRDAGFTDGSEFTVHFDPRTGAVIYVPVEADVDVDL